MNGDIKKFRVGSLECTAVSDGSMTYAPPMFPPPAAFLFANADKNELPRVLSEHGIDAAAWQGWTSPYICLLVDTGRQKILIDTGAGALGPDTNKLIPNLKSVGVAPADIDMVVFTHGHPDHVGGCLDAQGAPAFPRARWLISKKEWEFWTSEQSTRALGAHGEMLIALARKHLLPLKGKIELVDEESEVFPGVSPVFAPGHTPGLMMVSLASGGERLLCISDVLLHPVHIARPEWCAGTDVSPEDLVASRRRLFDLAAGGKQPVLAFHFPFPGLGRIALKGQQKVWKPM